MLEPLFGRTYTHVVLTLLFHTMGPTCMFIDHLVSPLLPIEPKVSSSTLKQLFTCTAANTRFNTHSLVHARQHIVLVLRLIHLGERSLQRGRGGAGRSNLFSG